jgi:pyrimidine oxygenase
MNLWPGEQHYKDRCNMLAEYATVLRELLDTGRSDFKGKYYQMEDCLVRRNAKGVKLICAGSSDEGLAFTARYADYAFAPVNKRLEAAAAKTGRKVGSYLLMMVIADDTDEKAMAKRQLYREGEDKDATKWLANQAAPNVQGGAQAKTTSSPTPPAPSTSTRARW